MSLQHPATVYQRIISCPICQKTFNRGKPSDPLKTCSRECANISRKQTVQKWHKQSKDSPDYMQRNKKIGKASTGRNVGATPWNKGLQGQEYLEHYIAEDGSSNLYTSLRHNKAFFKTTQPELKLKELLKVAGLQSKHNFFFIKHQYDFYVKLGEQRLIIECDGDFWHCSSRSNYYNPEVADSVRLSDRKKEDFIKANFIKHPIEVVRFWEFNLMNKSSEVTHLLQQLKSDPQQAINNIKHYYLINS